MDFAFVRRAAFAGRSPSIVLARLVLVLSAFGGCGGKVIWDVSGSGGAGGAVHGSTSSKASSSTSVGTGSACLTTVTIGAGPQGPQTVQGTKCFMTPVGGCPTAANAGSYITADPCHSLSSVDDACAALAPGQCCYDVTEELTCEG